MIFNEKLCFIHVPKAAGMSLSSFLLNNLKRKPIAYTLPDGHATEAELNIPGVTILKGARHEKLDEAGLVLEKLGKAFEDFEVIFSVIRNPYDLEVSRFKYLQNAHSYDAGMAQNLAMNGDFKEFAKKSLFWGKPTAEFERYYTLHGKYLGNMKILRFEDLSRQISIFLSDYVDHVEDLPVLNATKRPTYYHFMDNSIEEYIYKRYQWVFDSGYYPREIFES